jgi:hypothetical protein
MPIIPDQPVEGADMESAVTITNQQVPVKPESSSGCRYLLVRLAWIFGASLADSRRNTLSPGEDNRAVESSVTGPRLAIQFTVLLEEVP